MEFHSRATSFHGLGGDGVFGVSDFSVLPYISRMNRDRLLRIGRIFLAVFCLCFSQTSAGAEDLSRWRLDSGIGFRHFQQQVKAEVGDPRGQRLIMETEIGLLAMGSYQIWGPLAVGVFSRYDSGYRSAARFAGFDSEGRTLTSDRIGGRFSEFWLGPAARVTWRKLFFELGYAVWGIRSDEARDDLPSVSGQLGPFGMMPSMRWLVALGGSVPIAEGIDATLRGEYRLRYYDSRSGEELQGKIHHGTQNISFLAGVSFSFDR